MGLVPENPVTVSPRVRLPLGPTWRLATVTNVIDPTLRPPYLIVKTASEEEFYRLANEDSNWEYLDGRIVMHSPASNRHEDLFRLLFFLIVGYVDQRGLGLVRGSRFPMRLDERWSPEPEILFVRNEHEDRIGEQWLDGPADFVLEIVSEGDPRLEYREKLPRYCEAGIEEIWIVDPLRREVLQELRTHTGYERRVVSSGRLHSAVVTGFWIEADWLWNTKLPSAMECLDRLLS